MTHLGKAGELSGGVYHICKRMGTWVFTGILKITSWFSVTGNCRGKVEE